MRGFVANTDYDWFTYLRAIEPPIDEVNFWKPGSGTNFRRARPGGATLLQAESAAQRHRRVRLLCAFLAAAGFHGLAGVRRGERRTLVRRDA